MDNVFMYTKIQHVAQLIFFAICVTLQINDQRGLNELNVISQIH